MLDFATFSRSPKPNNYLLAPDGLCQEAAPDGAAPVYDLTPAALFEKVTAALMADPQYRELSVDLAAHAISVVAVTRLLRFKDDVDILVLPAGEGATFAIYSRSRVGHSDLGKNKKRVDALLAAI